ncbi:hypothetical protein R6Z07F_011913 [Ovis aries]
MLKTALTGQGDSRAVSTREPTSQGSGIPSSSSRWLLVSPNNPLLHRTRLPGSVSFQSFLLEKEAAVRNKSRPAAGVPAHLGTPQWTGLHSLASALYKGVTELWRRQWHPTPVLLPGESQGRGSLVGCRLWGCTELDTTDATRQQQQLDPQGLPCGLSALPPGLEPEWSICISTPCFCFPSLQRLAPFKSSRLQDLLSPPSGQSLCVSYEAELEAISPGGTQTPLSPQLADSPNAMLQYSSHLMPRADSLEKTLMLGKIEGGRRRGRRG